MVYLHLSHLHNNLLHNMNYRESFDTERKEMKGVGMLTCDVSKDSNCIAFAIGTWDLLGF